MIVPSHPWAAHPTNKLRVVHKVFVIPYTWTSKGIRILLVRHRLSQEFAPISGTVDVAEHKYAAMDSERREKANEDAATREAQEELGINLVRIDPSTTTKYFYIIHSDKASPNNTSGGIGRPPVIFSYRVFYVYVGDAMTAMTPPSVMKKGPAAAMAECEAMIVKAIGRHGAVSNTPNHPNCLKEVDDAMFVTLSELHSFMSCNQACNANNGIDRPVVLWDQFERMMLRSSHFQSFFAEKLPNFMSTRKHSHTWPVCPKFLNCDLAQEDGRD